MCCTKVNDQHRIIARQRLCLALSRDLADSLLSDSNGSDRLLELLNSGFQGFSTLSDLEIVEAIVESGLEERNASDVEILLTGEAALPAANPT